MFLKLKRLNEERVFVCAILHLLLVICISSSSKRFSQVPLGRIPFYLSYCGLDSLLTIILYYLVSLIRNIPPSFLSARALYFGRIKRDLQLAAEFISHRNPFHTSVTGGAHLRKSGACAKFSL